MPQQNFQDFGLSDPIHKAIQDMGFHIATPIQKLAISPILAGRDIVGQSQTGTGKTAAFGIPILERIHPDSLATQALILCPTRELAVQIAVEMKALGKYMHRIHILPVYGGQPIERQLSALGKGVQVVIGTPGRIGDHLKRGTLRLDHVRIAVLDEADKMLDMGFIEEIRWILGQVPANRQTLLFSATIPDEILSLSRSFQSKPEVFRVASEDLTVPEIEQIYFNIGNQPRIDVLTRLLKSHDEKQSLVFCNTKRRVSQLTKALQGKGFAVSGLHGDLRQSMRDRVMAQFRNGSLRVLIATDVAARGIDVSTIEMVVNYEVPLDEELYIHRIGRTGRAGKSGLAVTFVAGKEQFQLAKIQDYANTIILHHPLPSASQHTQFKDSNNGDSHSLRSNENRSDDRLQAQSRNDWSRLVINLGKTHRIKAGDILRAITSKTDLPGNSIGAIQICKRLSFIEVSPESAPRVIELMNLGRIRGHRVQIRLAELQDYAASHLPAEPRNLSMAEHP